jgi:hypothetical protein
MTATVITSDYCFLGGLRISFLTSLSRTSAHTSAVSESHFLSGEASGSHGTRRSTLVASEGARGNINYKY